MNASLFLPADSVEIRSEKTAFLRKNFPALLQQPGVSATRARRVSSQPIAGTNERGHDNRRSPDEADSISTACVVGSSRQPERRRARSRGCHPIGWFRQWTDRLNPVGAVSKPARHYVNAAHSMTGRESNGENQV